MTNYVAIRHLGATLPANIMAFKPLITIVFAYLILGEVLTVAQMLSGLLLLLGTWIMVRKVSARYQG
jgi:drug/metabolite transporter (DMT)-like permease